MLKPNPISGYNFYNFSSTQKRTAAVLGGLKLSHSWWYEARRPAGQASKSRTLGAGFTLLEILVSVAILAIITGILIANFKFKAPQDALSNAVDQVITSFRQAQTATLSGVKMGTLNLDYGLFLSTEAGEEEQIIIFADSNKNKNYDAAVDEKTPENCYFCSTSPLPTDIKVSALELADATPLNVLSIIFSATSTEVLYFNSALASQNVTVSLINTKTNETKSATVYYNSGQISR